MGRNCHSNSLNQQQHMIRIVMKFDTYLVFASILTNNDSILRRLSNVLVQLKSGQPSCPQLYIYSSADKVIPAGSVESFMEAQQKTGRVVRSCNFKSTPHVDHFRHEPELYATQLSQFLKECVLDSCRHN